MKNKSKVMSVLDELLQKDCPFEPWQFIETKEVLEWLWNNIDDAELQKWHMESIHDRLNYYLFNYAYCKMGLKPISQCSISELEQELERRKENNKTSFNENREVMFKEIVSRI